MPVVPSSYTPPALLSGGHLQTLYASLLRRVNFTYERRDRIETPDDDFLDLDWAESHHTGNQDRVAILVHGLEGNTKRTYMRGMARALTRRRPGWDVCAINLRGCSEEMNRRVPTYHSGKTDDLEQVIRHVLQRDYETVGLVGFSLGGNIVLKYLAEQGSDVDRRIRRAATFSVPVDLKTSSHKISQLSNWHYTQYFLRSLRRKIRTKAERHPGAVETAPLQDVHNLRDFDDAYTAPLHGFRDADDY